MSLVGRFIANRYGRPIPGLATTEFAKKPTRVLIAPVNYSGQGHAWAHSLEALDPNISARNMAIDVPGGFSFSADLVVPMATYHNDADWQQRQFEAASRATHMLIEAEEPPFGRLLGRSLKAQTNALESRGTDIAYLAHGTDIRLPSRHINRNLLSYYRDDRIYLPRAEQIAARNIAYLESSGRPLFVSTPDLLIDLPQAHWCPVVVDPARWSVERKQRFIGQPLRVAHAPSVAAYKGTPLILPVLEQLEAEGVITFTLIQGVPSAEMPTALAQADVLIDQFRSASYGVAACEAMAAGCVVIGQVGSHVRATVSNLAGEELPILEATPDTLEAIIRMLAKHPDLLALGERSRDFVQNVHDGRLAAAALIENWIAPSFK